MYVNELNCNWLDHPFATNKFAVTSTDHIEKIRKAGVKELSIDTERGLDVETEKKSPKQQSKKPQVKSPEAAPVKESNPPKPEKMNLKMELRRAVKVRQQATEVIGSIMEDVRLGKQLAVEKITPVVESMVESVMANQNALLGLNRIREMDQYTFEHSVSVSVLLSAFAKHLGMPKEDIIEMGVGGLLHDIGKTKTPLQVLNKPAKLTNTEFEVMRRHVIYSEKILSQVPGISDIAVNIAKEHHERYDGSGYPLKKKGDDISLYGQMAAIVDVYDAITADRCYHKGMTPNSAMKKLIQWGGGHFNRDLVQAFINCVGIFPPGTLVSLSDGRIAVVLEVVSGKLLYPVVRVVFDSLKRSFLTPEDISLSDQSDSSLTIVGAVDPVKWRIDPTEYLDIPHT